MNQLKKQTEADMLKLVNTSNQQLIMALFDLTDFDYGQLVFNSGVAYANRMTGADDIGFEFLIKTMFYWSWWRSEWSARDAVFLDTYSAGADQSILYDNYLFQHNIYRLKDDSLMQRKAASIVGYCMDEYLKKEGVK